MWVQEGGQAFAYHLMRRDSPSARAVAPVGAPAVGVEAGGGEAGGGAAPEPAPAVGGGEDYDGSWV